MQMAEIQIKGQLAYLTVKYLEKGIGLIFKISIRDLFAFKQGRLLTPEILFSNKKFKSLKLKWIGSLLLNQRDHNID